MLDRHAQAMAHVNAEPASAFAYLDDHAALGAHMSRRSSMMAGGRMSYELDAAQGKAVGSVIRMTGSMLGIRLFVEEVVTVRDPPGRKVWETRAPQRMIVIDAYRMGFEIAPAPGGSAVRVFIDYALPPGPFGRAASGLAAFYAHWCVDRMAKDAQATFAAKREPADA